MLIFGRFDFVFCFFLRNNKSNIKTSTLVGIKPAKKKNRILCRGLNFETFLCTKLEM